MASHLPLLLAAAAVVASPRSVRATIPGAAFGAEASRFLSRRGQAQTCYEVLSSRVLPPRFELGIVLPGTTLARREDGRLLGMAFNAGTFAPVADNVTAGLVCCHSGGFPQLMESDGSSPVFSAGFTATFECSQPTDAGGKTFPLLANILEIEILREAAAAAAPAVPPPLQCGDIKSSDYSSEFFNAEQSGRFLGVCGRCVAECGSAPLRSRCQRCCAQCPKLTTCFTLPSGLPAPPALNGSFPANRLSVPILVPGGRLLMFTYTSPVRGTTCCFEGSVPLLPFMALPLVESYRDRFAAPSFTCSDGAAAFIDPAVYAFFP